MTALTVLFAMAVGAAAGSLTMFFVDVRRDQIGVRRISRMLGQCKFALGLQKDRASREYFRRLSTESAMETAKRDLASAKTENARLRRIMDNARDALDVAGDGPDG